MISNLKPTNTEFWILNTRHNLNTRNVRFQIEMLHVIISNQIKFKMNWTLKNILKNSITFILCLIFVFKFFGFLISFRVRVSWDFVVFFLFWEWKFFRWAWIRISQTIVWWGMMRRIGCRHHLAADQIFVQIRLEKPRVRVLFHEGLYSLLCSVERLKCGIENFLCRVGSDLNVQIDLTWRTDRHKIRIDFFRFVFTFQFFVYVFVFFAFEPKLNVFFAEFCFKKAAK